MRIPWGLALVLTLSCGDKAGNGDNTDDSGIYGSDGVDGGDGTDGTGRQPTAPTAPTAQSRARCPTARPKMGWPPTWATRASTGTACRWR